MSAGISGARLAGKHVLVTGGLSGIGRAIAACMTSEGASVTIMDRLSAAREDGCEAAEVCRQMSLDVRWIQGDVTIEADIDRVFAEIGPIDALVNNAGVTSFRPLLDLTVADFDRLMSVNVKGVFLMTQRAVAGWRRAQRTGVILNVASNLAFVGAPKATLYCASKGAVATFTKAAAAELGPFGIRVNMLCPGPVETEFNRDYREQGAQEEWERATPLRNPGESIIPDATRIAPAAVFLVSDEARHVTGASLLIDGGTNSM
jgi:NAD(P)-dependent dehydrogenase (short-subunit alcohol dehydrogenase family)